MTTTAVTLAPLYLNDVSFVVEDDDYQAAIQSVAFTPSSKTVTEVGGTPDAVYTFPGPTSWTCDLSFMQDWSTANSLSLYLFNNDGQSKAVTFVPNTGGPTITATVVITAGAIGGDIGSVGKAKVSLGVSGKPVITPAGS
jgi:hypothetical protein